MLKVQINRGSRALLELKNAPDPGDTKHESGDNHKLAHFRRLGSIHLFDKRFSYTLKALTGPAGYSTAEVVPFVQGRMRGFAGAGVRDGRGLNQTLSSEL
jgi:hypothetical protein